MISIGRATQLCSAQPSSAIPRAGPRRPAARSRPRRGIGRVGPLWVLCLGLLLLGCGGGTDGVSKRAAGGGYFPLVPGAKWIYEIRSSLGNTKIQVTARGSMELPDGAGEAFILDETSLGRLLGFVETAPVGYQSVAEGYWARRMGLDYDEEGALRSVGREREATWFLPLDPQPGSAWGQRTEIFATPEGGGGDLGWSGEVLDRLTVSVPAGEFEDVAAIRLVYRDPDRPGISPQLIYSDFYAPGVGLVRSITEDPSGDEDHRLEMVLLSYKFPE